MCFAKSPKAAVAQIRPKPNPNRICYIAVPAKVHGTSSGAETQTCRTSGKQSC
jgi:hypothetical protein